MSADRMARLEQRRASIEAQVAKMLRDYRDAVRLGDPARIDIQQSRSSGFVGGFASVALLAADNREVES